MFESIKSFLSGNVFGEIKDVVMSYYPPELSPQKKAELQTSLQKMLHEKEMQANEMLNRQAELLNKRIAEQEGTAKDLKALPVIGNIVIFLRGAQRPVWGFATLYMDYKWFFVAGNEFTEQQQTALIVINVLVLGFLFGERTLKNLEPLIVKVFGKTQEPKI